MVNSAPMTVALICSQEDLERELSRTLLGQEGVERQVATRLEEAQLLALAAKPDLVMVDRDLPRAEKLVAALREDRSTRRLSIAVVARGDFDPAEVALLEAGANAVLRLPAGAEWNARLTSLMQVPIRRETRFPVAMKVVAVLTWGSHSVPATALNVSRHGVLLETRLVPLEVGDELAMEMRLPGEENAIEAEGCVVRVAGPGQFGVQFTSIDEAARDRIRCFVGAAGA